MIKFACDGCGRIKKDGESWVPGLAAEEIGLQSARREVKILSSWAEPQTVHPLAVNFCSELQRKIHAKAVQPRGGLVLETQRGESRRCGLLFDP